MGLTVILEANIEDYYCSSGNSAGFKVSQSEVIKTHETVLHMCIDESETNRNCFI